MSTYLQVTLGILTAWLFVASIGNRLLKRINRASTEQIKVKGQKALAAAIADELEQRQMNRERRAWQ